MQAFNSSLFAIPHAAKASLLGLVGFAQNRSLKKTFESSFLEDERKLVTLGLRIAASVLREKVIGRDASLGWALLIRPFSPRRNVLLSSDSATTAMRPACVEPWTFEHHLSEAVFIPAGCPHQVRNRSSCIKVNP